MNYVNDKFQRSFEIVAERFLSKIGFGELIVTFPSGLTKSFKGTNGDEIADLKLHNYKFISKIIKILIKVFYILTLILKVLCCFCNCHILLSLNSEC